MNTVFLKTHHLKLQEAIATKPEMSESEFLAQSSTTAQPIISDDESKKVKSESTKP